MIKSDIVLAPSMDQRSIPPGAIIVNEPEVISPPAKLAAAPLGLTSLRGVIASRIFSWRSFFCRAESFELRTLSRCRRSFSSCRFSFLM